jgi:DNA-binding CsgD family transcriptional regulator
MMNSLDVCDPVDSDEGRPGHSRGLASPMDGAALAMLLVHTSQVLALAGRALVAQAGDIDRTGWQPEHPRPMAAPFAAAPAAAPAAGPWAAPAAGPWAAPGAAPGAAPAADETRLSPRERQLLGLVGRGLTDREIAGEMVISLATVHSHLDRIRDKTGRRRRPQLTRLAMDLDLVRD